MMGAATPETWVLCDATHSGAPRQALRLTLGERGCSISIDIDGIVAALSGKLSSRFNDLIRIAGFVLAADGAVLRGRNNEDDDGEKWHRHFRFVIGVDDPSFWNTTGIKDPLEATLGFLSQDTFRFEFVPCGQKRPRQLMFAGPQGEPVLPWENVQEISLFSGGLDSFAGAADLIFAQKRNAMLVSHRSATKAIAVQNGLVDDLSRLARLEGCPVPQHVSVTLKRHDKRLRLEHTQRTRSLFYAAIAGAVASLIDRDRVCAYENGIIAMNLPIAGSVVGARATRTAHPRALVGFSKILSVVAGRTLTVDNPFALKSRSDVLQDLASSPALVAAKHTVSCAHVHTQTRMHPHCGVCSQCLDRRFGFLGTRMHEHDSAQSYAVDIAVDPLERPLARDLLLNMISAAYGYAECRSADDFVASHGEAARAVPFLMQARGLDADAANSAVFDLHRRHGESVRRAVEHIRGGTSKSQVMAENTLTALLIRPTHETSNEQPATTTFRIENHFLCIAGEWRIRFRNGPVLELARAKGLDYLSILLSTPGCVYSAEALLDLAEGNKPTQSIRLDDRGVRAVTTHLSAFEDERDVAQEMGDVAGAARCQSEIDALREVLAAAAREGPAPSDPIARCVEKELRAALAAIAEQIPPLADHLKENLQIGSVLWYRRSAMAWDVSRPPKAESTDSDWVPAQKLVDSDIDVIRDAREVARFCERFNLPTRPGKTKDGGVHTQRRLVHEPSFRDALRRQRVEERKLQDAADRALTARERKGRK